MRSVPLTWWHRVPLVPATPTNVGLGGDQSAANQNFIGDVESCSRLRFGASFDQPVSLACQVSVNRLAWVVLFTLACVAGTVYTAYDLAAPMGDDGFVVLPCPWLRFILTNTGAVNTGAAATHFYAVVD